MRLFALVLLTQLVPLIAEAQVKIPKNAHAVKNLWGWECDHGYVQKRDVCERVKVPKNARLTDDGHSWVCQDGYEKYRGSCVKPQGKN